MHTSFRRIFLVFLVPVLLLSACKNNVNSQPDENKDQEFPEGTKLVTVGFWKSSDCSGDTVGTITFPVSYEPGECYSWPGHSGENSATNFSCGDDSLTYTQWGSLTCSGGVNSEGTQKTAYTAKCEQDIPPTIYSRIIDFSGCK